MLARHVQWANLDGLIYILDLKSETYFALEPAYRERWEAIARYDRSPTNIFDDEDLYQTAKANGWLTNVAKPGCKTRFVGIRALPRALRASPLAAWACLAYVSASLQLRGFYELMERLQSAPVPVDEVLRETRR